MNRLKKISLLSLLFPFIIGCGEVTTTEVISPDSGKDFVTAILTETRTTQYFTDEQVPLNDINSIMDAGRNALSGMNMQPWHFSAIINQSTIKEIAGKMMMGPPPGGMAPTSNSSAAPSANVAPRPATSTAYPKAGFVDAPAAIAVACTEGNQFAAGLACENMIVAARAIGYGIKIVAGGASELNTPENRSLLGVPDNMNVIAILIVGNPDTSIDMSADGVTGASTRKLLSEVSTVIE